MLILFKLGTKFSVKIVEVSLRLMSWIIWMRMGVIRLPLKR